VWSTVHGVWWTWWECEVSLRRTHIVKVFYTHELANAPTHDITVWNALPSSVQAATSLISFQRELKIIIGALSTTESTHWSSVDHWVDSLELCHWSSVDHWVDSLDSAHSSQTVYSTRDSVTGISCRCVTRLPVCPSVCLSVCHKSMFYWNNWM